MASAITIEDLLGLQAACFEWADSYDAKVSIPSLSNSEAAFQQGVGLGTPRKMHRADYARRLSFLSE